MSRLPVVSQVFLDVHLDVGEGTIKYSFNTVGTESTPCASTAARVTNVFTRGLVQCFFVQVEIF